MSNADIISMALRNLFKRKLRTFLTVLGVVIGTAAIVVMISLGIAMNENFMKTLERSGDITTIEVRKPYDGMNGMVVMGGSGVASSNSGSAKDIVLDDNAIATFSNMPGVIVATPVIETDLRAFVGKYESYVRIKGIEPKAMELLGYPLDEGRFLQEDDKLNIVFGYNAPYEFRKQNDRNAWRNYQWYDGIGEDTRVSPVNLLEDKIILTYDWNYGNNDPNYNSGDQTVAKPKPYRVKGVGSLKYKSYELNDYVFMNIKEAQKIKAAKEKYENEQNDWGGSKSKTKQKGYDTAYVKCVDMNQVTDIIAQISAMGFECRNPTQYLDSMKEVYGSIQGLLGAVGAVSLFIAAIGITNTMIMAIYERTREIGVMKVIGASIKDIKSLFLLEAAVIGFFGGLIGIGLSLLVSLILNKVGIPFLNFTGGQGEKISSIPLWLCGLALAFSAAVGLISGYFPARRAMKLSALSAIKTE